MDKKEENKNIKNIKSDGGLSSNLPMGRRGPMRHAHGAGEKAKNFKLGLKQLVNYLRPHKLSLLAIIFLTIASTFFGIISPKLLGDITNIIVDTFKLGIDYQAILNLVKILFILYILDFAFSYGQRWVVAGVSQRVSFHLRESISRKINKLPLRYFDKHQYGDILSRISNDVDTISQSLDQSLAQIISSVGRIVGILVMMLILSWKLTLIALLSLVFSLLATKLIVSKSQKYFLKQQKLLGGVNAHIEEMFSAHLIVKSFNGEDESIKNFNKVNEELQDSAHKSQFFSGIMMPVTRFIGELAFVVVSIVGAYLALKSQIKIGGIQAFIQYLRRFNHPIAQIANIFNVLQSTVAASERVFEFLDEEEELEDARELKKLKNVKGGIEFKDLVFSYDPGVQVIKNFSAKIEEGKRVAIVGPTGAGKTTLVNLLMRFYELDSGAIKIDGVDIRDMKRSELRSLFAMVLQDTWLFNGSIKDNIAYGASSVKEEDIWRVAKAARADHFIKTLPESYDLVLNEEADNISQGEKQLLTIARAMLLDAPILILDEATSSVDTRTEVLIQEAMKKLMKGRTSFVIAHRLSTIKNADLILVIDNGNIIEQGKHQELLARNGFYSSLYNSQFST